MANEKSTTTIYDVKSFQNLTDTGRSLLSRGLRYTLYTKVTSVLRKGERVSGAYVVVSGQLRVFTISPDGNEATLYMINPGESCVLALNCIFSDLLYPAWVESRPHTKVAVIPGETFRLLFESEHAIRNMTVQAFSTVVFRLMAELEEVHTYKLEQRLANFLLLHATMDGEVRLTQREIASHIGTRREVIARVLGQLASAGHIDTGRNLILINDPEKLAELMKHSSSNQHNNEPTTGSRRHRY